VRRVCPLQRLRTENPSRIAVGASSSPPPTALVTALPMAPGLNGSRQCAYGLWVSQTSVMESRTSVRRHAAVFSGCDLSVRRGPAGPIPSAHASGLYVHSRIYADRTQSQCLGHQPRSASARPRPLRKGNLHEPNDQNLLPAAQCPRRSHRARRICSGIGHGQCLGQLKRAAGDDKNH
jgi:hypothetical protein